ncbi:MAG: hypothetical protein ACFBRM_05395 [Pikeienuella sp.]
MEPATLLFYGVWIGGSGLAALIGWQQGRNPLTCFVASVVLTPVLAVPGLLLIGRKGWNKRHRREDDDGL